MIVSDSEAFGTQSEESAEMDDTNKELMYKSQPKKFDFDGEETGKKRPKLIVVEEVQDSFTSYDFSQESCSVKGKEDKKVPVPAAEPVMSLFT